MPLDFPSSPTNGQYYNGFVYNSANETWDSAYAPRAATIPLAGTNVILNGAFDIWQRGDGLSTASSAANGFVADRWQMYRDAYASGGATYKPSGPPGIQYAARVQRNAGNTSTAGIFLAQSIESVNSIPFVGQPVTLSFYAKAGVNYSSAASALTARIAQGTGTDQNISSGFSGSLGAVASSAVTLTTSWQRFSITGTVNSASTQLGVYFTYTPVGTAGASDYFEITGVQLEAGTAATAFRRNAPSIAGELAACQRYYLSISGNIGNGYKTGADTFRILTVFFPVQMRITPSVSATWSDSTAAASNGTNQLSTIPVKNMGNTTTEIILTGLTANAEL